jgi:hypothetical protein
MLTLGYFQAAKVAYNGGMEKSAETVAHLFVRAINRQDAGGLADLMTQEHRFVDSLGNVVIGRQEARSGWETYFQMVPDYAITVQESYGAGPVVVMLGMARGTYVPPVKEVWSRNPMSTRTPDQAPALELKPENEWKTPAAFRVLVENGLVAEWQVYADNEPIRELIRKTQ